ncbi:PEP/pyruvate-binding domain-containing protein [Pseudonocardia sp. N23]|uniref:PEP/pyruvate-binding domain-containing protein n=1 Tax=Pseudonocardia sp. N23 TaxID=1987376 RepID=UPI000BFB269B|nr:PEP/pyruvate-binding domain-containing protein [Pseudonocardia sp. N23]
MTDAAGTARAGQLVVGLAGLRRGSLAVAGGKAANLGELVAAGLPVPDGFCVTTDAYTSAATAAGLPAALAEGAVPAALRARLQDAPVPAWIADSVRAAYAALGGAGGGDVPVAVRSSATAEDLPDSSFAGQQDTYLNVVGADAVVDAVRRCWASLWTDRAVAYRETAGIGPATVRLAVVVQRMVDAVAAGVLFTADPLTGTRDRAVLDAAPGLGESVVSGAVDPDHVVAGHDGRVLDYRVGRDGVAVRAVAGGGTVHEEPTSERTRCLSDAQVAEIVALGLRAAAHFGAPQDVEWAVAADGTVALTQSRPVTTLFPLVEPVVPGHVYLCVSLAQGLVRPMTPLGVSAARVIGATGVGLMTGRQPADPRRGPRGFAVAAGRPFVDVTMPLRSAPGRALLPPILDVMEARSAVVARALLAGGLAGQHELDRPAGRRSWLPFLRGVGRIAVRFRVPVRLVGALVSPRYALRHVARVRMGIAPLCVVAPDLPTPARLQRAEEVVAAVFPVLPTTAPVAGAGFVALGAARWLAGADLPAADVHEVLRSLPHNVTTEMDLRLWALAARLRTDPASAAALRDHDPATLAARYGRTELPDALQTGLAGFLRDHGHRAAAEIDLGVARWSDDPGPVLAVLAGYLRLPVDERPDTAPDVQFARGARAAEQAVTAVAARVRTRSRLRAVLVAAALRRTRALAGLREEHKDLLVRVLAAARAHLLLAGADLTVRGLLAAADDVVMLDLAEIGAAVAGTDQRALVTRRRAEHEHELRRRHVPRIVLADGTEPEAAVLAAETPADGALTGTAASAGAVEGPVRIVLDPADAALQPGEVLVVPSTDPGWTPLFLTAGALVMEMGGSNSHGAVVAREYGIPAVVGVPSATTVLRTGQVVRVDGAAGTVTPVAATA